jgi:hypothetical protein
MTDLTVTQKKIIVTVAVVAAVAALAALAWFFPHIGASFVVALATLIFGAYIGDKMRVESGFALVLLLIIAVALTVISAAPWAVGLAFIGVVGTAGGILAGAVN